MHDEPFLFFHEFNKQIGIILSNPDNQWWIRLLGLLMGILAIQAIIKVWKYSRSTLSTVLPGDLYLCHELIGKRSTIEARVKRLINPPKRGHFLRKRVFVFALLFLLLAGFLAIQIVWARHGGHSESPGCQHNMKE
ncbi:MAG: hypothetical protein ACE5HR_07330 [bacterium]